MDVAQETVTTFSEETYHGMLVGASLDYCPTSKGCVDGPRVAQYLGAFMTATNDALVTIGEPGSGADSWAADLDRWKQINLAQGLWPQERMDFAILSIGGDVGVDASDGWPYPTIGKYANIVERLSEFARDVYCVAPPPISPPDVPAISEGTGLTNAEYSAYQAEFRPALEQAGCTYLDSIWLNWEPTGVWRGSWEYPDFHPNTASAWAAAGRLWFLIYFIYGVS
jgi:hypothetical protein